MKRKTYGREIEWERNEIDKFIFTFFYDDKYEQCGVYTIEMSIDGTKRFIQSIVDFNNHNFLKRIFTKYFIFTTDTGTEICIDKDTINLFLDDFNTCSSTDIILTPLGSGIINDDRDSSIFATKDKLIFEKLDNKDYNYRCIENKIIIEQIIPYLRLLCNGSNSGNVYYYEEMYDGIMSVKSILTINSESNKILFNFVYKNQVTFSTKFPIDTVKTLIEQYERSEVNK